jgi:hypothetical protein
VFFSSSCPPPHPTRELAPMLEHRADYSVSLIFPWAVGLLGRVISSSQGLFLNTGHHKHRKMRTHIKHLCPRRNLNPQSWPPSDRRLFMPQTARLPRPAPSNIEVSKSGRMRLVMQVARIGDIINVFRIVFAEPGGM